MKKVYSLLFGGLLLLAAQDTFAQSQRMVLIEKGSNASCGPCAAQNPGFHSMLNTVDDKHIAISYQWYFPGYDPMNEHNPVEANARFNTYYGQNGVPTAMIDGTVPTNAYPGFNGGYAGSPAGFSASMINNRYEVASPFDISIDYTVTPSTVTAEVTVTASQNVTANQLKLRIAVIERVISFDSPPGTNGEETFYNVMKKFLPGTSGLNLPSSWTAGQSETFTQSWTHQNVYDFSQLAVVAFVQNDTNKEVLQAARADDAVLESTATNAATIFNLNAPADICGGSNTISPTVTLRNTGNANLTSAEIVTSINGVESTYNWTGDLELMSEDEVTVDPITFDAVPGVNTLTIEVQNTNNNLNEETNASVNGELASAPDGGPGVLVTIVTDNYGNETYWKIMDENGVKVAEGGNPNVENNYGTGNFPPPVGSGTYSNGTTYNIEVELDETGCYTFEIGDYFGDGMCCQYGQGSYTVRNLLTNAILFQGGDFAGVETGKFERTVTSISEQTLNSNLLIFPNPVVNDARVELMLNESAQVEIEVYDLTGKSVYAENLGTQPAGELVTFIPFQNVNNGMYLVNLRVDGVSITRKLTVNK